MDGQRYRQWIRDVIAKRLETQNYWLSDQGEAYLTAVWIGPSEDLSAMPEGDAFFKKQQNKMRRYLSLSADLMVTAAGEIGIAEISPEAVKRGTRAMIELKCFSWICGIDRMTYPDTEAFGSQSVGSELGAQA